MGRRMGSGGSLACRAEEEKVRALLCGWLSASAQFTCPWKSLAETPMWVQSGVYLLP